MACPFFVPTEKISIGTLPHPARLPLGAGWKGHCTATGRVPNEQELHDCNLGYAKCECLPVERQADAIRFSIAAASDERIVIRYACERGYRPVDCGTLEFSRHQMNWATTHPDARIQAMAACYLRAYLDRANQ
jgi:hypothetical protein